jgi:nucleoside-diphosphate-sugar epimerase
MFKEKRILVTGGTGTIGTLLVKRLINLGARVTVASLDSPDRAKAVLGDTLNFHRVDLRDQNNCISTVKGHEYVFHLMAVKGNTQKGVSNISKAYVSHLQCNTNMMEAAFQNNVKRYLFVGSICEYPAIDIRHEDDVWKGPPQANDKWAGISKLAGEAQAEAYYHEFQWDAVKILRLSNVYGPYDDFSPLTAQVIPSLIAKMINANGKEVIIAGDGSSIRDFIFSDDIVDAMLLAMSDAPTCLPINIGSGKGCSIRELAETISSLVPIKPKLIFDSSLPTGDKIRVLDTKRAKKILGYNPKTTIQEGIKKTIEWYIENKSIADLRGKELHG